AAHGFNAVRFPFSNELLTLGRKPTDLPNIASGIDMMHAVVDAAKTHSLKVVFVRHAGPPDKNAPPIGLRLCWDDPPYNKMRWISDWTTIAQAFSGENTVMGFDLAKEPGNPGEWLNDGSENDWVTAAQDAGNAILGVNPNVLIIVEGVES